MNRAVESRITVAVDGEKVVTPGVKGFSGLLSLCDDVLTNQKLFEADFNVAIRVVKDPFTGEASFTTFNVQSVDDLIE